MLRCLQIGMSIRDLELVSVGLVIDMNIEAGNDQCEDAYTQLATQADFDNF